MLPTWKSILKRLKSKSAPTQPITRLPARRNRATLQAERLEDRTVPSLMLSLQEDGVNGGNPTVVATAADFTAAQFTGTYGDFQVSIFGGASHNGANVSFLLSSTTDVQNIGASTATLNITVFQDDFTLPTGSPLTVESGLGGTVNAGALSLANIFQASASSTNNTTFDFTNGPQTATPAGSTFQTGSATGSFNRIAGDPYALSSTAAINLTAGGEINYSSHVNVTAPPSPPPSPGIAIVKFTNGTNNDSPPTPGVPDGPIVPVGSVVTWTYTVTNPGNEPIAIGVVTDDNGTPGDTSDDLHPDPVIEDLGDGGTFNVGDTNHDHNLDVGEAWQYTLTGTATAGQYSNLGTVTGTSTVTNTPVTASNPDHYFGALPDIQIIKLTNGTNNDSAPGLSVPVGTPITWTYNVTAAGSNEPIKNVVVTDDNGTPGNPADDFHPTPVLSGAFNVGDTNHDNLLESGETWQYTASGGLAVAGQYTNNSVVTGNGNVSNTPVTDHNPDNYFGTLSLGDFVWNDVNVNGIQDSSDLSSRGINGVLVDLKDSGGNVIATTTTVNNPVGGAAGYYQFSGLAPGSYTVVIDSSNFNSGGALFGYSATPSMAPGSTTANDSNGSPAPVTLTTANDETIDFGYFVPNPQIQIIKLTNGTNNDSAPGLSVPVGTPITWTYNVTAAGSNEPIKNVVVTDDNGTPGNPADDFHPTPVLSGAFNVGDTNHDNLLESGETWQYTASGGLAVAGQYTNNSVVTGNGNVSNTPVTDHNPDNYFGITGSPDLLISKTADSSSVVVGSQIGFTVTITNTGSGNATGVALSDPLPGMGDLVWTIASQSDSPNSGITFAVTGAQGKQVLTLTNNGSVTLHPGEVLTVHVTSPTTAADTTGSSTSTAPTWLGAAGDYAVLYTGTGGHNLSITNVTVHGNVGVGGTGHVQFSGPGTLAGRLDFAAANTGQYSNNNSSNVGPTSVNYGVGAVTTALNTVTTLSSSLAGLGTSIAINGNQTINESAGQLDTVNGVTYRVFNVTSYSENDGKLVTLNGDGSGNPVVFNFGFSSNVNLGGDVALMNGLTDDQVVWNFTSGKDVSLNNNASSYPTLAFHGIILGPTDKISIVNASLSGRIFGGNSSDMQIVSGDNIRAPLLNTATVTASNVSFDSDDTAAAPIVITKSAPLASGQSATLGFWKNAGQAVILNFNGGSAHTELGNWLATNFPNLFGGFAGKDNTYVANQFKTGSTSNTYQQAFAIALDIYATTTSLGGASVISGGYTTKYGFKVSDAGDLNATWDVGGAAGAFDIPSGGSTVLTISQILKITDNHYNAAQGQFYYGSSNQATYTDKLNTTLCNINEKADIKLVAEGSNVTEVDVPLLTSGDLRTGELGVSVDGLSSSLAADELARIDDAISTMNSELATFGITLVDVTGTDAAGDASIRIHMANSSPIGGVSDGVLGVTLFGGDIILINGWNYYLGSDVSAVGSSQYDFQTVATHEIGHAVGLGHSTDAGSVMYPYLGTAQERRELTDADLNAVREVEDGSPEPLMAAGFAPQAGSVAAAAPVVAPVATAVVATPVTPPQTATVVPAIVATTAPATQTPQQPVALFGFTAMGNSVAVSSPTTPVSSTDASKGNVAALDAFDVATPIVVDAPVVQIASVQKTANPATDPLGDPALGIWFGM